MIDKAVVGYLRDHKRLILPDFGAFLRKDDTGEIVFMEFLRKDDGQFTAYLQRLYALSADEAAQAVSNYVAALRKQTAVSGEYRIEGLGTLRHGQNNTLRLEYDPLSTRAASRTEPAATATAQQPAAPRAATPSERPAFERPAHSKAEIERELYSTAPAAVPLFESRPDKGRMDNMRRETTLNHTVKVKSRVDMLMIIAIIIALLAIGIVIYGEMLKSENDNLLFGGEEVIESIIQDDAPTEADI